MRKLKNQARQKSIGTVKRIRAAPERHQAAEEREPGRDRDQLGREHVEGPQVLLMPLTKRWCCQTKKLSSVTPSRPATASL